jgi:hypothetical protein
MMCAGNEASLSIGAFIIVRRCGQVVGCVVVA